jgi:hypothetical protein
VSPAAADTLPTTTLINGPYNLVGSVSVSVAVPGALGSTGTTGSGAYFDYLYEFSISQDSYVTATIGPVDGSAFSEMHMMFYDVTPAGPDESLYTGADLDTLYTDPAHPNPNPNLIDVGPTAHRSTAGSGGQSSGGGPAPVSPGLAFRNLLAAGLRHPRSECDRTRAQCNDQHHDRGCDDSDPGGAAAVPGRDRQPRLPGAAARECGRRLKSNRSFKTRPATEWRQPRLPALFAPTRRGL